MKIKLTPTGNARLPDLPLNAIGWWVETSDNKIHWTNSYSRISSDNTISFFVHRGNNLSTNGERYSNTAIACWPAIPKLIAELGSTFANCVEAMHEVATDWALEEPKEKEVFVSPVIVEKEPTSEWIEVSVALPPIDQKVLVAMVGFDEPTIDYLADLMEINQLRWRYAGGYGLEITHWRLLPKLPS